MKTWRKKFEGGLPHRVLPCWGDLVTSEYINVDMAVDRAIKLAIEFNQDKGEAAMLKTTYLARALNKLSIQINRNDTVI